MTTKASLLQPRPNTRRHPLDEHERAIIEMPPEPFAWRMLWPWALMVLACAVLAVWGWMG